MAGTGYRKSLQRLSQRLGLGRFLDWWTGELSAMVPRVLSGAAKTAMERRALVEIRGSQVMFSRVAAGKVTGAGRLDMALLDAAGQKQAFQFELDKIAGQKDEIVLVLPPERVLRKKLFLPLVAEENLRQVIAFEMDRLTPFKVEQVYFDCRFARRDKQLEVSLAVAPRATIDEPLRQLAAWDAQVAAVLVADEATDGITWNLLPEGRRQKGRNTGLLRLNIALASGAMALLCVVLALPVWQKRETLQTLHPLLDKTHQQAVEAENLRRQFEALLAEYNYLLDKKRESPPVVAVLEDVTRVLPDDTWVQQFDLKGKEVLIQGETASSSKLAGLFEQAKTLHNANFRAPLTKGQGANSERFQLAAETRPLPRAETESQPAAAQPARGLAALGEKAAVSTATAAPVVQEKEAVQEKDRADQQPSAMSGAAKADSKPVVTKAAPKPISAPATSARNQRPPAGAKRQAPVRTRNKP